MNITIYEAHLIFENLLYPILCYTNEIILLRTFTIKDTTANQKYREQYRANIANYYNGWMHFSLTTFISLGIIIFGISRVVEVSNLEWLTIPVAFLYSNLAEYLGHKGPMHHKKSPLQMIYHRHTKQHHVFFTNHHMPYDRTNDYKAVLFPIRLILFFFGLIGIPTWLFISWLFSTNVAWLFAITGVAYFLNYEWLHFAYHSSEKSWVNRIPGFKKLKKLHTHHHNHALMTQYNFNITYPICDKLFGTYYKDKDRSSR